MKNLLPKDGEVYLLPQFFSCEESDSLYQSLLTNIQWKHEPIMMFGKEILQYTTTCVKNNMYFVRIKKAPVKVEGNLMFTQRAKPLLRFASKQK